VDGEGAVLVADTRNHRIRKISPAGMTSTLAGSWERGHRDGRSTEASFFWPNNVSLSQGNILVTEGNRIRRISPDGSILTLESFPGELHGLAVAPNGTLFATDCDKGQVHVLDTQGRSYSLPNVALISPRGVCLSPGGGLLVTDSHRVVHVEIAGLQEQKESVPLSWPRETPQADTEHKQPPATQTPAEAVSIHVLPQQPANPADRAQLH